MSDKQTYYGATLFLQENDGWWLHRGSLTQWEDSPLTTRFSARDESWSFAALQWFDEALPEDRLQEKFDRIFTNKTHEFINGQRVPVTYPPLFEIVSYQVVASDRDPLTHNPVAYVNVRVKAKTEDKDFIDKNRHVRYHLFGQKDLETLMNQYSDAEIRKKWCKVAITHKTDSHT